ncbi:family 78 glycoside hydrolase catalytic domain [candidate division KSB1 bacterium]|nr:family 78 glycoside hydrolase catalytic domain [candidate division KSB1 bacterium]
MTLIKSGYFPFQLLLRSAKNSRLQVINLDRLSPVLFFIIIVNTMNFVTVCLASEKTTNDLANASWIGSQKVSVQSEIQLYGDNPAPIFRREFNVKDNVRSAILTITAAGYYNAQLNGEKIGRNYLDPAWTNFSKRIYYRTYNLTNELKTGQNCLGVTLGNGFYNPLPMTMWGYLNLRKFLPTGNPVFIASLRIEYENGQVEEIATDYSWKYASGPIRKNNVYLGAVYDANQEIPGWEKAGFDDTQWMGAVELDGPGGILQEAFFPPIQVTGRKEPVSITALSVGKYLVDMGVNFTGLYHVHLAGEPGDSVTFRFGERVYENGELNPMTTVAGQLKKPGKGGPGAPDTAWQADTYIFGKQKNVWYSPEFTFHTYRYMEISGLQQKPMLQDIEGLALNTNVENKNAFSCSSDLINSIQEATERTFLANLQSVQSDCPAREKFGYGGDLNATSEAFIYNFDMQSFYRKTIYDWVDAISDTGFIDTAPFVGIQYCGLSWESAFLITQYKLYLYYNDVALVKELYTKDLAWMEKVARIHPEGLVEKGLSDHESLKPVPVALTGTAHHLECARIMAQFAAVMQDVENEKKFSALALKLSGLIRDRFWRQPIKDEINRQTLFATLLYYDILPEAEKQAGVDSLLASLAEAPAGHFITGIFGTKFILEALSKEGHADKVYAIVNSTAFPGWGHMIDRGATTIWETWKESNNTFSNCHPMFGSVSEWFYKWLGGIRPDQQHPGFKKFIINPVLPEGLASVNCSYYSPHGEIISNWINDDGRKEFEIKIPAGTAAHVKLPLNAGQKMKVMDADKKQIVSSRPEGNDDSSFELSAGHYWITVESME